MGLFPSAWSVSHDNQTVLGGQLTSVGASPAAGPLADGDYLTTAHHWVDTLIMAWSSNNNFWTQQPTPSPNLNNDLNGVSAVSATNAWAVGYTIVNGRVRTLILDWNGTAWSKTRPSSLTPPCLRV